MKSVCVLSVPRTGTRFVERLFLDHGWKGAALNEKPAPGMVYVGHATKAIQCQYAQALGIPIVIPMRHPYAVEASWRRLGWNMDNLFRSFENLRPLFLRAYMIPVDSGSKKEYLSQLSKVVGVDLTTDWAPVPGPRDAADDFEPSARMVEFVKTLPFMEDCYATPHSGRKEKATQKAEPIDGREADENRAIEARGIPGGEPQSARESQTDAPVKGRGGSRKAKTRDRPIQSSTTRRKDS